MQPKTLAKLIKSLAEDKKAINPIILDVSKISDITSYFVIISGSSSPHVKAIADNISKGTKEKNNGPVHYESDRTNNWIVVDHFDVITHVFHQETREYYNLERLWGEAEIVE